MGVLDQFSLAGRTALVTGGGTGIGKALAIGFAEAGADVAVLWGARRKRWTALRPRLKPRGNALWR